MGKKEKKSMGFMESIDIKDGLTMGNDMKKGVVYRIKDR